MTPKAKEISFFIVFSAIFLTVIALGNLITDRNNIFQFPVQLASDRVQKHWTRTPLPWALTQISTLSNSPVDPDIYVFGDSRGRQLTGLGIDYKSRLVKLPNGKIIANYAVPASNISQDITIFQKFSDVDLSKKITVINLGLDDLFDTTANPDFENIIRFQYYKLKELTNIRNIFRFLLNNPSPLKLRANTKYEFNTPKPISSLNEAHATVFPSLPVYNERHNIGLRTTIAKIRYGNLQDLIYNIDVNITRLLKDVPKENVIFIISPSDPRIEAEFLNRGRHERNLLIAKLATLGFVYDAAFYDNDQTVFNFKDPLHIRRSPDILQDALKCHQNQDHQSIISHTNKQTPCRQASTNFVLQNFHNTSPIHIISKNTKTFDGTQDIRATFKEKIQQDEGWQLNFHLTNHLTADDMAYTESTPMMPLIVGNFSIYQAPSELLLNLEGELIRLKTQVGHPIHIQIKSGRQGSFLWVNGKLFRWLKSSLDPKTNLRLGAGFKKRFWSGEIAQFELGIHQFDTNTYQPVWSLKTSQ